MKELIERINSHAYTHQREMDTAAELAAAIRALPATEV